jgi:hypothetical protein
VGTIGWSRPFAAFSAFCLLFHLVTQLRARLALISTDKGGEAFKVFINACHAQQEAVLQIEPSLLSHAGDVVSVHVFFSLSLSKQCQHI